MMALQDLSPHTLVADIGGTHARFALCANDGINEESARVLFVRDYPTIGDAMRAYAQLVGKTFGSQGDIHEAGLAIACPVESDHIAMTNHHWEFSRRALQQDLGLDVLVVANDFAAQAAALVDLPDDQLVVLKPGHAVPGCARAVLGPGSGLGCAALIELDDGRVMTIASEGGHMTLAPQNSTDVDLIHFLWQRHGHLSAERLLSGPGLQMIWQFRHARTAHDADNLDGTLAAMAAPSPAEITQLALDTMQAEHNLTPSSALCRATLGQFCRLLGGFSGNFALATGARGGVYLAGGILPKIQPFLQRSHFAEAFCAKGRFRDWLESIPVMMVVADNPALRGMARLVAQTDSSSSPSRHQ